MSYLCVQNIILRAQISHSWARIINWCAQISFPLHPAASVFKHPVFDDQPLPTWQWVYHLCLQPPSVVLSQTQTICLVIALCLSSSSVSTDFISMPQIWLLVCWCMSDACKSCQKAHNLYLFREVSQSARLCFTGMSCSHWHSTALQAEKAFLLQSSPTKWNLLGWRIKVKSPSFCPFDITQHITE